MKKLSVCLLLALLFSLAAHTETCQKNYLNAVGNKLYDSNGKEVRLTGVNWFGFETAMGFFHGLWARDHKSMLQQIKDQGFNCIRVPWNNAILEQNIQGRINPYGTDPYTGVSPMNKEESTKTKSIEILDIMVKWCQENDMKVILDNHSREPDGYMGERLWYTAKVSHQKWIEDWEFISNRYKDYDAVIGMDINNEPHGKYGAGARWGTGNKTNDWRLAAQQCGNAILAVNPNVLIFVEGVEEYKNTSYWWGGNLHGAKDFPVVLSNPEKLVYSPHEYGPTVHPQSWFSDPSFPANMPEIWENNFNYLHTNGSSPLFVGEFGIKEPGGVDEIWFDTFLKYMHQNGYSWTFWCWNPNSGDTGGLLDDQWKTIVAWKMNKLKAYLEPEIPNCKGSTGNVAVSGVEITPSKFYLKKGEKGQLTVTVLPTNATNKSVIWSSADSSIAIIDAAGFITAKSIGNTTLTARTVDGNFEAESQLIVTENSGGSVCGVEVPSKTPLPTINSTYKHTHIIGNGPLLDNISDFTINWDLENNGLWQLSINTNNGIPSWWNDIKSNASFSFNTPKPLITLSETGIPGLDGSYHVAIDSQNFVMAEQSGTYTIYFSNSISEPCNTTKQGLYMKTGNLPFESVSIYPIPFKDEFFVKINSPEDITNIEVFNSIGQLVKRLDTSDISTITRVRLDQPNSVYFIRLLSKEGSIIKSITKN